MSKDESSFGINTQYILVLSFGILNVCMRNQIIFLPNIYFINIHMKIKIFLLEDKVMILENILNPQAKHGVLLYPSICNILYKRINVRDKIAYFHYFKIIFFSCMSITKIWHSYN